MGDFSPSIIGSWKLELVGNTLSLIDMYYHTTPLVISNDVDDIDIIWQFERHLSHNADSFETAKQYIQSLDQVEVNRWFKKLQPIDFHNYFIPIPIPNKYFCMETMEIVELNYVHTPDDYYPQTGYPEKMVVNADGSYSLDTDENSPDLWYKNNGERYMYMEDKTMAYFTNDKFKQVLNDLYKMLLSDKTYVSTANEYMFLQRFSYNSNFSFD